MGTALTEQTEIRVWATPDIPKYVYWPDRLDQIMGIGQTEQTKKMYRPDLTDQNMVFDQTEQTKTWVLARQNRPKYGYWPDRTDQNCL